MEVSVYALGDLIAGCICGHRLEGTTPRAVSVELARHVTNDHVPGSPGKLVTFCRDRYEVCFEWEPVPG